MAPLLDATFVVACARGRRPSKRGRQARSLSSRSNARSGGSALLQNHPVLRKRSSRQALQGVAAFVHRAALFCLTALCEEHAGSTMMGNLIITAVHCEGVVRVSRRTWFLSNTSPCHAAQFPRFISARCQFCLMAPGAGLVARGQVWATMMRFALFCWAPLVLLAFAAAAPGDGGS